jgi:hypothetical protein
VGATIADCERDVIGGFVAAERGLRSLVDAVRADGLSPAGAEQIVNCLIAIEHVAGGKRTTSRRPSQWIRTRKRSSSRPRPDPT